MKKKTIIAVLLGIAIAFIASNAIAGAGHHVDVNGVVCPTTESGRYQTDTWGQCIMEPREFNHMFADSWQEEMNWITGTIIGFAVIGFVIFLIIPFVPMMLSPIGKWTWAIGVCVWIITNPYGNWNWLYNIVGI